MSTPITLYYTSSIDGFIADDQDNQPWALSSWQSYLDLCRDVGHLIMGRRTYELFLADQTVDVSAFKSLCVVSHSLKEPAPPFFCARTPKDAIVFVSSQRAAQALLLGGTKTATAFLREGLLNHLRIDIEPVVLGNGRRMFAESMSMHHSTLLSSETDVYGRTTQIYQVTPCSKG